jgi:uncharacterized protein (DUF1684 family)
MMDELRSNRWLIRASFVALVCCSRHEPAGRGLEAKDEPAWRARNIQKRLDKDHEFATSATSSIAAVARFAPSSGGYLALDGEALRFDVEQSPAARIGFQPGAGGRWSWQFTGEPVKATTSDGAHAVSAGDLAQPTLFGLSDRFAALAQVAGGTFVITGFDARRKERVEFKQLLYFPLEPRFVVKAQIDRLDPAVPVQLMTTLGLTKPFLRYATLRFELDGTPSTLVAFVPVGSSKRVLFVPFRDATSGKESYPAARFVDLEEPRPDATELTLDFNDAFNPLCNYSPVWNCPLPPPENNLSVAVRAGERAYPH